MSPKELSFTKNLTVKSGELRAVRSGNVVVLSGFCSISGLPTNGKTAKMFSGLPPAAKTTRGIILGQYSDFVADFYIDTGGNVYVTNKSNVNDVNWVVLNLTYITA